MPEFYKQYRFKDNDQPVESWDQFLNIRIGARLIKDTGDEYQKVSDNVYSKVPRYFLSNQDIEDRFAELHATNTFVDPQYLTAAPIEPYHIVNKEYVDALVASAAVDLSGFARLDAENIWEQPQICNSEPESRVHLTNKGYVDDRINEIEFDTTALAKLNSPNVFTAPQSVTVESTAPEHLVTKQYVDDTRDGIINNISGFVRADLPNTFTATQDFQYIIKVPYPQTDPEAANKLYVDTKVSETQQSLGNFAGLDLENVFEKNQTFQKYAICNSTPVQPYHLVNKQYVDGIRGELQLPEGIASTNTENVWDKFQIFADGISVPTAVDDDDVVTKGYVDQIVQSVRIPDASTVTKGIVMLTKPISATGSEGTQSLAEFAQDSANVPTAKDVADYVANMNADNHDYARISKQNIFSADINLFKDIITTTTYANKLVINGTLYVSDMSNFNSTIMSNISGGSIITMSSNAQIMPSGAGTYTMSLKGDYDSYDITINDVLIPDEDSPTLGFSEGTMFLPRFKERISLDAGQDIEFGSRPLSSDLNSWVVGTILVPLCVFPDHDPDYGINPGNTTLYIGIVEKLNKADYKQTQLYPGANLTTPNTNSTDGIVTTKYLFSSPWLEISPNTIMLIDDAQRTYINRYDFYKNTVQDSENGALKLSVSNFIAAVENRWITGNVTVAGYAGINIPSLDASGLTSLKFSDLISPTVNISHAKHLVLSDITNVELNTVNSTTIVRNASGEINASRRSHVILEESTAVVNLTLWSTCDDSVIQCEGTADATSFFYTKVGQPETSAEP